MWIDGFRRARVPILLLLGMVAFLIASYGYEPAARALPVLVAWVTIAFLILEILVQAGTSTGRRIERLLQGQSATPEAGHAPMGKAMLYAVGWPGLLVGLVVLVGMLPAVFAYVCLSLKVAGGKPLPRALAMAAAVTVFAWLLFEWGLSYRLYRGVLLDTLAG
jgi:hypothetical protein